MNQELAKLIALRAFRSSSEIGSLVYIIGQHCSEEEHKEFGIAIATAIDCIQTKVLQKVYDLYPELEKEFDAKIDMYGTAF